MRRVQVKKGDRFTRLEVIEEIEPKRGRSGSVHRVVRCKCDCGKEIEVFLHHLRFGESGSCGCLGLENRIKSRRTHGQANKTKAYGVWNGMNQRCCNPNQKNYKHYGGRGISVCERWKNFENFYADMGDPNGLTLDRIDVNGDYCPENCRWVTWKVQHRNRRDNSIIEYKGKKMTLPEAADLAGLPYGTLKRRIKHLGWSIERAIETPKLRQGKKAIKNGLTP